MNVKEFYENIGGNYSKALETMMMDDFIKRMLTKFYQSTTYNDLYAASKTKDVEAIFHLTHTLKGVGGNLALTPLQEKATIVCELTRNQNTIDLAKLEVELNELLEIYQKINVNLELLLK